MPERLGSFGWGVFYLAGGVIVFVFLLIKWFGNNDFVKFGFYISILASLGLAVGGFLTARERGDLAALQNRGAGGTGLAAPAVVPAAAPPAATPEALLRRRSPRPSTDDRRDPRPRTGVARVRRSTPPGRTPMTETTLDRPRPTAPGARVAVPLAPHPPPGPLVRPRRGWRCRSARGRRHPRLRRRGHRRRRDAPRRRLQPAVDRSRGGGGLLRARARAVGCGRGTRPGDPAVLDIRRGRRRRGFRPR